MIASLPGIPPADFSRVRSSRTFVAALSFATAVSVAACSPTPKVPAGSVTVIGTEHLGWDQEATSGLLSDYTYVAYVDDVRVQLPDASCQSTSDAGGQCTAALPPMGPGAHRLELAAVQTFLGVDFESPRSQPLELYVSPSSVSAQAADTAASAPRTQTLTTADGVTFTVETLSSELARPSAVAPLGDGRVLIAEANGDIRVWDGRAMLSQAAVRLASTANADDAGLIDITAHPDFARNHELFVAYTARQSDDTFVNRIVRFREADNALVDPQVLLEDRISSPPVRPPRIRFGPDRKLYVAFPAGRDRAEADDPALYAGKILRLNEDGTTPRDNRAFSPIVTDGARSQAAFAWNAAGQLWRVVHEWNDTDVLRVGHASTTSAFAFKELIDPSAATFYRSDNIAQFQGDLLIAALGGRQLRRVRFDRADQTRVASTEALVSNLGRISDIVEAADGSIYFCTSNGVSDSDRLDRLVRLRAADGTAR